MVIKLGDIEFEGPHPLLQWGPPYMAGIYAIMMLSGEEKVYHALYISESERLSYRSFYRTHNRYNCWEKHAGSIQKLYIAFHRMPKSTQDDRKRIEQLLINHYNPPCNY